MNRQTNQSQANKKDIHSQRASICWNSLLIEHVFHVSEVENSFVCYSSPPKSEGGRVGKGAFEGAHTKDVLKTGGGSKMRRKVAPKRYFDKLFPPVIHISK